jgi:hypothetical protein
MPNAYGLVNDVLIALSARSIGASVITKTSATLRLFNLRGHLNWW